MIWSIFLPNDQGLRVSLHVYEGFWRAVSAIASEYVDDQYFKVIFRGKNKRTGTHTLLNSTKK